MKYLKYYAVYDAQLEGFRPIVSDNLKELVERIAEHIYDMSQNDLEPASADENPVDLMNRFGFEIRKISKETYEYLEYGDWSTSNLTISRHNSNLQSDGIPIELNRNVYER